MAILTQIENDFQQALKQKETSIISTLRLLLTALKYEKINKRAELEEEDVNKIVKSEIKKRKEAIEEYTKAERTDLADKEQQELTILAKYLPEQLSEDVVKAMVQTIITQTDSANFGQIMGKVMAELKGQADGAMVKKMVEEALKK